MLFNKENIKNNKINLKLKQFLGVKGNESQKIEENANKESEEEKDNSFNKEIKNENDKEIKNIVKENYENGYL